MKIESIVRSDKLRLFHLVCETRNMSIAASILKTSQPNISRAIKSIEINFDAKLFHRTGRGLEPTLVGKELKRQVDIMLRTIEQAEMAVNEAKKKIQGNVYIGVTPMVAQVITEPLTRNLKKLYPEINLHVLEGQSSALTEWIVNGRVDLAVTYKPPSQFKTSLDSTILYEEPLCLVERATFQSKTKPVTFREIGGTPLALPSPVNGMRSVLDRLAKNHKLHLNIEVETDSAVAITNTVRAGHTKTILPALAVKQEVISKLLIARPIIEPEIISSLSLYVSRTKPIKKVTRCTVQIIKALKF